MWSSIELKTGYPRPKKISKDQDDSRKVKEIIISPWPSKCRVSQIHRTSSWSSITLLDGCITWSLCLLISLHQSSTIRSFSSSPPPSLTPTSLLSSPSSSSWPSFSLLNLVSQARFSDVPGQVLGEMKDVMRRSGWWSSTVNEIRQKDMVLDTFSSQLQIVKDQRSKGQSSKGSMICFVWSNNFMSTQDETIIKPHGSETRNWEDWIHSPLNTSSSVLYLFLLLKSNHTLSWSSRRRVERVEKWGVGDEEMPARMMGGDEVMKFSDQGEERRGSDQLFVRLPLNMTGEWPHS